MSKAETMIPQLRFEGFEGEWLLRELGELVSITTGKLDANAMKENGQYDFYTSGIQKYKIDVAAFEGPAITIAGNGATVGYMHYADGKFNAYQRTYVLTDFKATRSFLFSSISLALPRKIHQEARTGSIPYIVRSMLTELAIRLPSSIEEQTKIGELFQKLDRAIELQQQKVEQSERYKKAMLQKMFPQKGETEPQLRFEGFSGAWDKKLLGDLMEVTSVKRIHKKDWTTDGVRFLRARDIVAYMNKQDITEPLYISEEKYNEYTEVSGKVSNGEVLVTGVGTIGVPMLIKGNNPLYFKDGNIIWFKNKVLDGNFLYYSFVSEPIQRFIKSTSGIGTVGTYTIDSGKKTPIKFPFYEEQTKIGEFFQSLDIRIEVETKKLNYYESLKKAMLQRMFV